MFTLAIALSLTNEASNIYEDEIILKLVPRSYFYEEVLLDELSIKEYKNYVLKISIRV